MSADDCLTPELFSLALAAHRLERHLNPASVPFDAPMLDRRQFLVGQPVDTMLALGGIRKLLDGIYQHYGWQKLCVMPLGLGLPLLARGVAGLRPGVGDELSAWGDALRPSDAIVGDMVASLAAWVRKAETKPCKVRRLVVRRAASDKPKKVNPLTPRQAEVVQIVGECNGNLAEAGRRLGRDRKTIQDAYKTAMGKLGKTVYRSRDRVGNTTHLYGRDKRGQSDVSTDNRRG